MLKPNSLQQRMLAISGQNIDEFMKEMENVHKKRDTSQDSSSSNSPLNARNSDSDDTSSDDGRIVYHTIKWRVLILSFLIF